MSESVQRLRDYVADHEAQIIDAYVERLAAEDNGLLLLGEAAVRLSATHMLAPIITGDPAADTMVTEVAVARAAKRVSPAESIRAIGHFYAICADVLTDAAAATEPRPEEISLVGADLHRTMFARVYGAALPYAHHLLEQISRAHLDERKRMARDLHDRAAHSVAAARFGAELRAEELRHSHPEVAADFEAIIDALTDASISIHEVSQELGRSAFVERLVEALGDWIDQYGQDRIKLTVTARERIESIPEWMQDELYFAVREGIRNALAHTDDEAIAVSLAAKGGLFRSVIVDHGSGIPEATLDQVDSSGEGLGALRDRVTLLGGSLDLQSSPQEGTSITIEVPMPS